MLFSYMIGENNIGKISSVESGRCNSYVIDLCSAVAKFDLQQGRCYPCLKTQSSVTHIYPAAEKFATKNSKQL